MGLSMGLCMRSVGSSVAVSRGHRWVVGGVVHEVGGVVDEVVCGVVHEAGGVVAVGI